MSQSDFVSRGQALVAAGQFQEAVKVCRLGLLGRPTTVEGRVVLGQALLALKRFDEVLAEMRVALELDSSSLAALVLRAEALLRKGDTAPAIEALHKARQAAPGDVRILQLLGEAEHSGAASRASVTHPSVGFVGSGDTRHYVGHTSGSGDEGGAGYERRSPEFTQPTSIASPTSRRQSAERRAASEATDLTPPPDLLDGDGTSGTVELDPELEGIEVPDGEPEDVPAAPPRGAMKKKAAVPAKKAGSSKPASTMPLDIDMDIEEMAETAAPGARKRQAAPAPRAPLPGMPGPRAPGPGTAVRNAVAMPSGVIGDFSAEPPGGGPRGKGKTVPPPFSQAGAPAPAEGRPHSPSVPPPFAQTVVPPAPLPPAPRSPIAAALPTVAAAQPPPPFVQQQVPYPATPASLAAAARPTMAVEVPGSSPTQLEQSGAAIDQLFGHQGPGPAWAQATMAVDPNSDARSVAAAHEPTARPQELDPQILAMMSGNPAQYQQQQMMMNEPPPQLPSHLLAMDHVALPMPAQAMRTGVRKSRSKTQIVLLIVVGVLVIGGGVFAGFQIRAMRLEKKIAAAREQATELAKADTFAGWTAARDSLSSIVGASSTVLNRAALARTRAQIAYEFGDGLPEARAAVEQLNGEGGLDGRIAVAFDALLRGEPKAAKTASDAAVAGSDADATAQYLAGEAALLGGNAKLGIAAMKMAVEKDARPLFGIGLARAYAAAYNWEEAIAAIDRVLGASAEHPGAVIARANILASSGRIFPSSALGNEVKQQLERVIVEGKKTGADSKHLVAPMQLAQGHLALARVELARGDLTNARKAVRGATDVNIEDARFAEETIDTLYALGELALARTAAEISLKQYPTSMRVRIGYAEVMLAQGRPNEAIDTLGKQADVLALPDALAVRGMALLAIGDTVGAASDFDGALKVVPTHEPAIVGRTWQLLVAGDLDAAAKPIAERMSPKGASHAVQIAYAATLRRSADAAQRDQARTLLEKIIATPAGPEAARAHLELARIYRDAGDFNTARGAYEKATRNGSVEAKLETALLLIEYSKPIPGREMLDKLLEEAGDRPSAQLVVETARARMLVGEHLEAGNLLALADKMSSVERWKLDRERGRFALRKSDFTGAATALSRALDGCGSDAETFLLAADAATADKTGLADKVRKLAPERLKDRPEAQIVTGKLLIASDKAAEAEVAYKNAKQALRAEKASNRRLAQADFGLAVIEYYRQNLVAAQSMLDLVMQEDPTIVDAYIFASEITKEKKKAYEYAQTAARYNPDYAYAWMVVGKLAAELKDKTTLSDAIARLSIIAPTGDELKELQKLRGN